jgi:hypothetical protein
MNFFVNFSYFFEQLRKPNVKLDEMRHFIVVFM